MHGPRTLALLAAAVPILSGCTVLRVAHLVCIQEQELFCDKRDEKASLAAYRSLADEAWATHGDNCPEGCFAGDYAWGFREGFAQYVYAGGTGEPPAVPPRPYWQLDLRTPEGATSVQSWFEGYRFGARLAREGGYRKTATLTVSASLADCDACGCPDLSSTDCNRGCEPSLPSASNLPEPELIVPPSLAPATPALIESEALPAEVEETRRLPAPEPQQQPVQPPALEGNTVSGEESRAIRPAIFQIVR